MKKGIITFNTEHELVTLIENVPEKMKNNSTFTNPPPALAELEKEGPEFRELLRKARNRDKEWVADKHQEGQSAGITGRSGSISDRHL
jgi:hypothetical protein